MGLKTTTASTTITTAATTTKPFEKVEFGPYFSPIGMWNYLHLEK